MRVQHVRRLSRARARPIDARCRACRDIGNINTCPTSAEETSAKEKENELQTSRKQRERERERGERRENGRSSSSSSIRPIRRRVAYLLALVSVGEPVRWITTAFSHRALPLLGSSRSMKMLITAANRRAGDNERPALHLESPAACAETRLSSASALVCAARMSLPPPEAHGAWTDAHVTWRAGNAIRALGDSIRSSERAGSRGRVISRPRDRYSIALQRGRLEFRLPQHDAPSRREESLVSRAVVFVYKCNCIIIYTECWVNVRRVYRRVRILLHCQVRLNRRYRRPLAVARGDLAGFQTKAPVLLSPDGFVHAWSTRGAWSTCLGRRDVPLVIGFGARDDPRRIGNIFSSNSTLLTLSCKYAKTKTKTKRERERDRMSGEASYVDAGLKAARARSI